MPLPASSSSIQQNNLPHPFLRPSLPTHQTHPGPSLPQHRSAGRPPHTHSTLPLRHPVPSIPLSLSTSNLRPAAHFGDAVSPVVPSSSSPISQRRPSRPYLRSVDTNMTTSSSSSSSSAPSPLLPPTRSNLHKRGSSGSSLSAILSPCNSSQTQFVTPFAVHEEADAEAPFITTPKIKPYLRKMSLSTAKEDQGYVDLSKSVSENERLSGLGIQDFGARSVTDPTILHPTRGHDRTTSVGSQISNGSSSFKSNQPFTHPMKQVPRSYTPQTGIAYASSVDDEAVDESDDVVVEDVQLISNGFRSRRSMSISSMATTYPTPLSQSYTPNDLDFTPKPFGTSQSNLSIISSHSAKSKKGRNRRNTDRSTTDYAPSPALRSSFDQTFSFGAGQRPDIEPPTREERIRAARRKFEEKEASRTRKAAREAIKQREAHEAKLARRHPGRNARVKSGSPLKKRVSMRPTDGESEVPNSVDMRDEDNEEKLQARSYAQTRPTHPAALPHHVLTIGAQSEKPMRTPQRSQPSRPSNGSWLRFSTWLQTRMLSCGGRKD